MLLQKNMLHEATDLLGNRRFPVTPGVINNQCGRETWRFADFLLLCRYLIFIWVKGGLLIGQHVAKTFKSFKQLWIHSDKNSFLASKGSTSYMATIQHSYKQNHRYVMDWENTTTLEKNDSVLINCKISFVAKHSKNLRPKQQITAHITNTKENPTSSPGFIKILTFWDIFLPRALLQWHLYTCHYIVVHITYINMPQGNHDWYNFCKIER